MTTGLFRFRSPLLAESRLMSFPPATEMFQFAGFASRTYRFSPGYRSRGGLPHSEIPGSPIARISPGLFAACHVLHRLSVPRHPPDALLLRSTPHPSPPDARLLPKTLRQTRAQPTRRAPGPPPRSRHVSPLHPINQPPETASHRPRPPAKPNTPPSPPRPPGGGERVRTDDLLLAKQALSQLSYTPVQMTEDRRQKTEPAPGGGPGRI